MLPPTGGSGVPCTVPYLGEFGEVYKAHLITHHKIGMPRIVAVKTLKGSKFNAVLLQSGMWYDQQFFSNHTHHDGAILYSSAGRIPV